MDDIIIYGNSSVARIAYYNLLEDSPYTVSAFTVDREVIMDKNLYGLPVLPFDEITQHFPPNQFKMLISVGYREMNKLRQARVDDAEKKGYAFINYISSKATTCSDMIVGTNCMVGANTVVHPGVKIGNNVIIRENCFIGHNAEINDHCFVSAGATIPGNVTIDSHCFLGVNSTFKDGIKIAKECFIGAGVVMLQDTKEKEVYMSRPAQKIPIPSDRL